MITAEWTPITEVNLFELLARAESGMASKVRQVWENIRLTQPELWQQHPWGDEGCGFWVVAVFGRTCVYFNDITSGFCHSSFREWGNIDTYSQETPELENIIENLFIN